MVADRIKQVKMNPSDFLSLGEWYKQILANLIRFPYRGRFVFKLILL